MREERDEWLTGADDEAAPLGEEMGEESPLAEGVVRVADELVQPPPERVRFTAPVAVRLESGGDTYLGAVLNLSTCGVACTVPAEAGTGERVWLKFKLGLAEEALHLLCEVIWRNERQTGDPIYGLRFASLTPDEEARIGAAVSARSEGRAGEWPLPVVPEASAPRRGASPVVSAAAGMVAGIALALLLSVLPKVGVSQPPPMKTAAPWRAEEPAAQSASLPVSAPAAVVRPARPEPAPDQSAAPALLPKRAAPAAAGEAPALRPLGTPDRVEIALLVDGPPGEHTSFWLDNPRRLVVDVHGRKNGFAQRTLLIDHPLAKRIRVGQHPDKVRFVIETAPDVAPNASMHAKGEALVVALRRR